MGDEADVVMVDFMRWVSEAKVKKEVYIQEKRSGM